MFMLLERAPEIAAAQRILEHAIRAKFRKAIVRDIGFPSDTVKNADVRTDGKYWFHTHDDRSAKIPRKVNWFGLDLAKRPLEISVEINVAYRNAGARIAGFFARDSESGAVCLFHSGGLAGGTKGVGKIAFLRYSKHELVQVSSSSGRVMLGALVVRVERGAPMSGLMSYIDSVARFKQAVRDHEISRPEFKKGEKEFRDFYSEAKGRRRGKRRAEIDYVSRHGDVVDALYDWRNGRGLKGLRIVKNSLIDMGVLDGEKLVEVYEVKSSADRQDVYTAIGQTLVHGLAEDCRRTIVIPANEPVKHDLRDALERLRIRTLRFSLMRNDVKILPT